MNRMQPGGDAQSAKFTTGYSQNASKKKGYRACPLCGGRRVIRSPNGIRSCPACVAWQLQPDYVAGRKLMSESDLNLGFLGSNSGEPKSYTKSTSQFSDNIISSGSRKDTEADVLEKKSGDEDLDERETAKRKHRRSPKMTEERRLAIKAAMQNRGPLSPDHRRKIADALAAKHRADPGFAKRPKRCSHCGKEGHNRRTCPELVARASSASADAKSSKTTSEDGGRKGRSRIDATVERERSRKIEDETSDGSQTTEKRRRKFIVVEEENDDERMSGTVMDSRQRDEETGAKVFADNEGGIAADVGEISRSLPSSKPSGEEESDEAHGTVADDVRESSEDALVAKLDTLGALQDDDRATRSRTTNDASANRSGMRSEASLPTIARLLAPRPGGEFSITPDGSVLFPLPGNPDECVAQATSAVLRGWRDGIRRQSLELLLPQPNGAADSGWPGGIRQQFRAALPMVEGLLLRLKTAQGLEGRITAEWLDEGDCVGAWQSEKLAAVVFPTAETLPAVRRVDDALSGKRLMLVINSQWQPQGNVVSDFGFGSSRRAAERFVGSLEDIYCLRRVRVLGDEVRLLRCYPGQWQVYYVRTGRETQLLSITEGKPTYQDLIGLLKNVQDSHAGQSWLDRVFDTSRWNEVAPYAEGSSGAVLSPSNVWQVTNIKGKMESEIEDNTAVRSSSWDDSLDGVERDIVTGEVVTERLGDEGRRRSREKRQD